MWFDDAWSNSMDISDSIGLSGQLIESQIEGLRQDLRSHWQSEQQPAPPLIIFDDKPAPAPPTTIIIDNSPPPYIPPTVSVPKKIVEKARGEIKAPKMIGGVRSSIQTASIQTAIVIPKRRVSIACLSLSLLMIVAVIIQVVGVVICV